MKRFAIILLALIAINSSAAINSVEAKATRTTKIVQTVKRKKINRKLVRKRLIYYGMKKGMIYSSKLSVSNSSWLPPICVKYYDKTTELISAGRESIRDLLDYYERYEPGDIAFNVVASKKYLYILYG
jgi:hypothetical protein